MTIRFFEPLGRAWNRMKVALFRPFDLHKWLVVGFTAFLAGLADWNHGSSGSSRVENNWTFREFLGFPGRAWDWLMGNPLWSLLILFGISFLIVLGIVLLWLSSRGKFMFLDNVVHDKAEVANPWREYKREGNSLFLWRLIFALVVFSFFVLLAVLFFTGASQLYEEGHYHRIPVLFLVMIGLVLFFTFIVIGYISIFLDSFVVPVMYKERISATRAWGRFLSVFVKYPFHFILFGLLMLALVILFVISVIFAGLFTCCIGFFLLIIPYVGTVVTLPAWYWFRAFSVEFLAQCGDEFNVFPPADVLAAGSSG
jgi:MFS family permease